MIALFKAAHSDLLSDYKNSKVAYGFRVNANLFHVVKGNIT